MVHKRHFQVQLGEFGLTVGAGVLVAIAAGQLIVAFHPAHHQHLLEQLWGLRQGVPRTGTNPGGHHKVTGPFWGRTRQGGGLYLDELVFIHDATRDLGNLGAQHHVFVKLASTQIHETVAQPDFLPHFTGLLGVFGNLERQGLAGVENLDLICHHFDFPGGDFGVLVASGTLAHLAGYLEDVLVADLAHHIFTHHQLHDSRGIAEIHEGYPAVVTTTIHPACQGDGLSIVFQVQFATLVSPQHSRSPFSRFFGTWVIPAPCIVYNLAGLGRNNAKTHSRLGAWVSSRLPDASAVTVPSPVAALGLHTSVISTCSQASGPVRADRIR